MIKTVILEKVKLLQQNSKRMFANSMPGIVVEIILLNSLKMLPR